MTNSRELAEQAFTLLQSALEESESRRHDLEAQLGGPRPESSDLEEAYDSLQAECQRIRTERDLWKKTSNQLQDVVSNERSKAKRLTKKLGFMETGADRMSRKEVSFWREKAAEFEAAKQEFQQRIHELKDELCRRDEHDDALRSNAVMTQELGNLRDQLEARETRIAELCASLENSKLYTEEQDERIAELDADVRRLSQQVIDAETARNDACRAADQIDAQLKDLRAQAAAREQDVEAAQQQAAHQAELNQEYQRRIDELETQHDREIEALRQEQEKEFSAAREQFEQALAQVRADAGEAAESREATDAAHAAQLAELTEQLEAHASASSGHAAEIAELTEQLEAQVAETAALEAQNTTLGNIVEELRAQTEGVTERTSLLEGELAEERLRGDNLNELANERREALGKTTEKLEEMEERYEDARWQLGKARHFERLVKRRKTLIANLIATVRARQKANTTLKAGLDSLRRYKAAADERAQELLRRIETLENSLSEAREKLTQANPSRRVSDGFDAALSVESAAQESTVQRGALRSDGPQDGELHSRMLAQAEVIENLETDLRNARFAENEARAKVRELQKLHNDIETKNTFIDTLQKDLDEQQKLLAKLRKLDIEVRELRDYIAAQDRRMTALREENSKLRNAKSGDVDAIDRRKIEEQQELIERLSTKIREYEDTITTLSEAADSWKRKYDFLASETPFGYESAGGE